ncbi:MAG: hypothetical protein Q7K43_04260, partial [Candidatus Woesearchaeota archaeon]|nr:hypothetical protein [Candidatus Woesearchaeota archaeon]
AAEEKAQSYGATDDMIHVAKVIIDSLPYKIEEKYPTIKEKYLVWMTNIFVANAKNIDKNIKSIQGHHYPTAVQKDFFEIAWFQVIIIHSYTEAKEKRPYDVMQQIKLENIELEANTLETDIKKDITDRIFPGWEFSTEKISAKNYKAVNIDLKQYEHPWYKQRERLTASMRGKLEQENVLHRFADGNAIVLIDKVEDAHREGHITNMCLKKEKEPFGVPPEEERECIAPHTGGFWKRYESGEIQIISLRNANNEPIATGSFNVDKLDFDEIRGKHDQDFTDTIIDTKYFQPFKMLYTRAKIEDMVKAFRKNGLKANKIALTVLVRAPATPVDILVYIGENCKDKALLTQLVENPSLPEATKLNILNTQLPSEQVQQLAKTTRDSTLLLNFIDVGGTDLRLCVALNKFLKPRILEVLYVKEKDKTGIDGEIAHEIA